jgi:RNA polymerase sigma-70 factor (ECF subfamily)
MLSTPGPLHSPRPALDTGDDALVERVRAGELAAFELLMRRHNQRLYRLVRSILHDDAEVEDVMQESYCAAFAHLDQFAGRASFLTWLLTIGRNEALARRRRRARLVAVGDAPEKESPAMEPSVPVRTPEERASSHELVALVEAAVDRLPDDYRQVFALRVLDALDTAETAEVLGLSEDAVKQRLHRARALLQGEIEARVGVAFEAAFGFLGPRCDRVVAGVMRRISGGTRDE